MSAPTVDLSTITDAAGLKQCVAQALRAAGQHDQAAQWERETAGNDSLNGLHIKLRSFVAVVPWPLPARE